MDIVIFSSKPNGLAETARAIIASVFPRNVCQSYTDVEDLMRRLHQPPASVGVAVLIPADKGNLSRLVTDANLFERLHVILALPDEEEATTRLGHLLYPRVVLHANQLVDTLEAILRKALVASPVAAPQQVPTTPPKYALCDVEDLEQTLERRRRT